MSTQQPPRTTRTPLPTETHGPSPQGAPGGCSDVARPSAGLPLLLTVAEAAESLRLSRTRLYELVATGELPSVKIGRSRRVSGQALRDYVQQLEIR